MTDVNQYNPSPTLRVSGKDGEVRHDETDQYGNKKVTQGTALPGSDYENDVTKVQQVYNVVMLTADNLVNTGVTRLHTATFSCNDAAPTAGSIIFYNNTAESGTQIFNHTFTTTPFAPFTVTFDCELATGLYVGFTTTADVNVTITFA